MAEQENNHVNIIRDAIKSDDIPKIYANGYTNFIGSADVGIVLKLNGEPNAVINMSYTTAKSIYLSLQGLIENLERDTGNEIMTEKSISEVLNKPQNPNSE